MTTGKSPLRIEAITSSRVDSNGYSLLVRLKPTLRVCCPLSPVRCIGLFGKGSQSSLCLDRFVVCDHEHNGNETTKSSVCSE